MSRPVGEVFRINTMVWRFSSGVELKAGNFYQASIYAWNAYREDKTITTVKYDTKKGLYAVAA